MSAIELRGVSKSFGKVCVVDELNIEIDSGEFLSILGPSGCGKTTLLRMVAGLEQPSSGEIRIGDQIVKLGAGSPYVLPAVRHQRPQVAPAVVVVGQEGLGISRLRLLSAAVPDRA